MHYYGPGPGDSVAFRADVYVEDQSRGAMLPVRGGRFLLWMESTGDALAVVQTPFGRTRVRWSMIEGVESPRGLPITRARPG